MKKAPKTSGLGDFAMHQSLWKWRQRIAGIRTEQSALKGLANERLGWKRCNRRAGGAWHRHSDRDARTRSRLSTSFTPATWSAISSMRNF